MGDKIERPRTEVFLGKQYWITSCFQEAAEERREEEKEIEGE